MIFSVSTSSHQLGNQEVKYLFSDYKSQQATLNLGFITIGSGLGFRFGICWFGLSTLSPFFQFRISQHLLYKKWFKFYFSSLVSNVFALELAMVVTLSGF